MGDGSSGEESSYGSPRASLSRLKARGASLPFQSPVTHQPESPSTPVINTEPCFLFHSFILPMTQTFNGGRQESTSEILGSALDFCMAQNFFSFLRYPLSSNADSRGRETTAVFFGKDRKCIVQKALASLTQSVMLDDSSACMIFLLSDLLGCTVRNY